MMDAMIPSSTPVPYEPRRSSRIKLNDSLTQADGDTWEEKLVVCEAAAQKLVIRSCYRNRRTKQRVWDEPPSGASHIQVATSAARHDAQVELKELSRAVPLGGGAVESSSKKKGFFSAFKKKKDTSTANNHNSKKGRSFFSGTSKKKTNNNNNAMDRDGDEDLQRAISASMGLDVPKKSNANNNNNTSNAHANPPQWNDDQEALDMARAISMSEAANQNYTPSPIPQEDYLLQQAIEASQQDCSSVAAVVTDYPEQDSSVAAVAASTNNFHDSVATTDGDIDFFNQKMPAKTKDPPASSYQSTTTTNLKAPPPGSAFQPVPVAAAAPTYNFDPYATAPTNSNNPISPAAAALASMSNSNHSSTPTSNNNNNLNNRPMSPAAATLYEMTNSNHGNNNNNNKEEDGTLRKMAHSGQSARKTKKGYRIGMPKTMYASKKSIQEEAGVL